MEPEKEQVAFDIGGDWLATATPNEGGEFKRMGHGDFKFKIVGTEAKPKKGEKPHVMLKMTAVALAAYSEENKDSVGMTVECLYAGSKESPKFMKDRLACLIRACKVQVQPGKKLNPEKDLVGREFDGTVFHELSDAQFDEATGTNSKRYVNARLCGERPVGSTRSPSIDPVRMSAAATQWLEKTYGGDVIDEPAGGAAGKPEWEQPETQPEGRIETQTGYKPEAEADKNVHEYRAFYKLDTPMAEQARGALVQAGFDPEGPIDPAQLSAQTHAAYIAKFPPSGNGALPSLAPLGGAQSPKKGTRAPK